MAGAKHDDDIAKNEVFGPVVSVTPFSNVDDAVNWQMIRSMVWHHLFGQKILKRE